MERANSILLDSFWTTMRIYKPGMMSTFTLFVLTSEFEKSHLSLLFTWKIWEPQNELMTEILEGFKSME